MADQKLKEHPKTLDLMNLMTWDVDTTIGKLFRFWWWCVDYAEDGDLRKHNDARIAASVGLNGVYGKEFVEAMVKSGWIDRDPYFRVHDWWDCIGKFLQIKYKQHPEKYQIIRNLYDGSSNTQENTTDTTKQTDKTKVRQFLPPTLEEVSIYCIERKNGIDAKKWHSYYAARGWKYKSGQKMVDWQQAVITWEKESPKYPKQVKRPAFLVIQEYSVLKWDKERIKAKLFELGYSEKEVGDSIEQMEISKYEAVKI